MCNRPGRGRYCVPLFPSSLHTSALVSHSSSATEVDRIIKPVIEATSQFELISDSAELYGAEKNIPVHTIRQNDHIHQLHSRFLTALESIEPTYTIPYMGAQYGPHVTSVDNRSFASGSRTLIQEIYLAQAHNPNQIAERIIVKKYSLLPR